MSASTRFALGTFAASDGRPFAGLAVGERVVDLGPHLGDGVTLRSLVDGWDRSFETLQALADRHAPAATDHALASPGPCSTLPRLGAFRAAPPLAKVVAPSTMCASAETMR